MSPSVSTGSNRGTTATAPPVASVAISPVDWPRTCENGAAPSTTSAGPKASASAAFRAAAPMLPWVRTAPLETPEVPEVKRITAGSAAFRSTSGAPSPTAVSASNAICVTPSRSAGPVTSGARSASNTTADAETAPSRSSISAGRNRTFTGTTTAPSRRAPKYASTNDGSVRQHDRHAVARADTMGREVRRRDLDPCTELRVGDGRPLVDQGRSIRVTGLAEDACEVRVHGSGEQSQVI